MSPRFCRVFLSFVCSSAALAQSGAPARVSPTVTPGQGQAIVAATWTRERERGPSPDCSHLVHEIYSIAGFRYPYTDSFDLYAGTANFVRVAKPQPGDLIVWRGHVGIVINPTERSFYSSLNSGLGTDFYDAPYWKARGPARFYRYIKAAGTRVTLAHVRAARTASEPVNVTASADSESRESTSPFAEPTEPQSDMATAAAEIYDPPAIDGSAEIPSSILVPTAQRIPNSRNVAEAVSELNNAAANMLREYDSAQFTRRIVIYDKLAVEHVDVKGLRGWANIRIDSRIALTGERIERALHHEEVRWKLVRTTQGWEIVAQADCVYVPRDVAVHQLAARLTLLTQEIGATQTNSTVSEEAQIIRILSTLVPSM